MTETSKNKLTAPDQDELTGEGKDKLKERENNLTEVGKDILTEIRENKLTATDQDELTVQKVRRS